MRCIEHLSFIVLTAHLICWTTAQDAEFTQVPGVIKTYTGEDSEISFQWEMSLSIGSSDYRYLYRGLYDFGSYVLRCYSTVTYPGNGYSGRVICINPYKPHFKLTNITEADAGEYTCRVRRSGVYYAAANATVYIYKKPKATNVKADFGIVTEGKDVTLTCETEATSIPAEYRSTMTYTWKLNNTDITSLDRHQINNDTLVVSALEHGDRFNIYSCVAQEVNSTLVSEVDNVLKINLICPPLGASVYHQPPGQVHEGTDMSMTCSVEDPGNPSVLEYSWYRENILREEHNKMLDISSVSVDGYDGSWECRVDNGIVPMATHNFELIVYTRPLLDVDLEDATIPADGSMSVMCSFLSRPVATVEWLFNGNQTLPRTLRATTRIINNVGYSQKYTRSESSLSWQEGDNEDRLDATGSYMCVASNSVGSERSSQMNLNITPHSGLPLTLIIGVTVGALLSIGIVIVAFILYRKGIFCNKQDTLPTVPPRPPRMTFDECAKEPDVVYGNVEQLAHGGPYEQLAYPTVPKY